MRRFLSITIALVCFSFPVTNLFAHDYTPVQISLVPGLAFPFGVPDAGISLGAVGNISGKVDLLQAAGVFNIAQNIGGIQAAGVFNIADELRTPVQAAGVFNIASGVQGLQVAGVFNIAGNVQGAQIGPVFNIAGNVEGFQVGLINVADTMHGVQIGLINISSNGVFDLLATWEPQTEYIQSILKTGNTSVYGVYSISMPKEDLFTVPDRIVLSTGFGTRIGDSRTLFLDLSVSASQAIGPDAGRFFDAWACRNGLTPVDVFAPWPTLDAGLSLNLGGIHFIGGVRSDIYLDSAPNLPANLAKGWKYSNTWFGESFTAWTKWYIGLGF